VFATQTLRNNQYNKDIENITGSIWDNHDTYLDSSRLVLNSDNLNNSRVSINVI